MERSYPLFKKNIMEHKIRHEMHVLPCIDPKFEVQRRIKFIQSKLLQADSYSLVLGISGGIDSTTCGRLAQLAINELNQNALNKEKSYQEESLVIH